MPKRKAPTAPVAPENSARQTPAPRPSDRRRERRYSCEGFAEISVSHPDLLFRGQLCDLSLHGCLVRTCAHLRLTEQAKADILFTLNNRHFHLEGAISNIRTDSAVGLEFRAFRETRAQELRQLIDELTRTNTPPTDTRSGHHS